MKKGDMVTLADDKILRDDIRKMRGMVLDSDKMSVRVKVVEGKSKGLIVWLPPKFFEAIRERVVFT